LINCDTTAWCAHNSLPDGRGVAQRGIDPTGGGGDSGGEVERRREIDPRVACRPTLGQDLGQWRASSPHLFGRMLYKTVRRLAAEYRSQSRRRGVCE
jgi:hypothetical protein